MISFNCDNEMINCAARIATGDIVSNYIPFQDGLLEEKKTCVMAGIDYDTPWTRDTAINTVNAVAIMNPEIAKNTMLSVLEKKEGSVRVGGQYWDKVLWIIAADRFCDITDDREFRKFALEAAANTLAQMEEDEFDPEDGLFRGPAVYGDGVAAYPDRYTQTEKGFSGILEWKNENPDKCAESGYGIPIKALSTNLVYLEAYRAAAAMAGKTGSPAGDSERAKAWLDKAEALNAAINRNFWNEEKGSYNYLFDKEGACDYAEALGLSFAILSGAADEEKTRKIIDTTYISKEGIPVLWPSFPRYDNLDDEGPAGRDASEGRKSYGRHSGTVWPHAQGFWALAMRKAGNGKGFDKEFYAMAERAVRDMQFAEIYHPDTGEIYGGMQELWGRIILWKSCAKQTWSATAFWAMIFYGIAGITYTEGKMSADPYLPKGINEATLSGIPSGSGTVTIRITRNPDGSCTAQCEE